MFHWHQQQKILTILLVDGSELFYYHFFYSGLLFAFSDASEPEPELEQDWQQ